MEQSEKDLHRPVCPPISDTQARLNAFFNDELDNDSVCGTENTGEGSRHTPEKAVESDKKNKASLSLEGTPTMGTAAPAQGEEPTPPMPGAGWKQRRQAAQPAPTLDVKPAGSHIQLLSASKDNNTEAAASVEDKNNAVPHCVVADTQEKSAVSPDNSEAGANSDAPAVAGASATEVAAVGGDAFGSQLLPVATGTLAGSPAGGLISAQPDTGSEPNADWLQTQIETPLQTVVASGVAKAPASAPCTGTEPGSSIPDTQVDLFDSGLLAAEACTAVDLPSGGGLQYAETQAEVALSPDACHLHSGADNMASGGSTLNAIVSEDPSRVEASAVEKKRSSAPTQSTGAVTPELQAFAAGCSMPSATGTVIPESDGQGVAKLFTQPTLLLPDTAPKSTEKRSSQGELVDLASEDGDVVQNSDDAEDVSPVENVLLTAGTCHAETAQPVEAASPAVSDAGPEKNTGVASAREQEGAAVATLATTQTDPVAGTSAVDGTHRSGDVGDACARDVGATRGAVEPGEAPEAAAADNDTVVVDGCASGKVKEDPVLAEGDVQMHDDPSHSAPAGESADAADFADVVHESQDRCGSGVGAVVDDPKAASCAPAGVAALAEDAEVAEAPSGDVAGNTSPVDVPADEPPADGSHGEAAAVHGDMEDVGEEGAGGSSIPHDSPGSLPDSLTMLMMTQPADTVDLAAVDGGINALAMQLCGGVPGSSTAGRSKASTSAGRSKLANVTKLLAGEKPSTDAAAAIDEGAPVAAVQPDSQGPVDASPIRSAEPHGTLPTSGAAGTSAAEDGDDKEKAIEVMSQLLSGGSDRAAGPQPPQRPSRSNRKRPPRLCATPSPAQRSERTNKRAKPDDAQDAPDVKAGAPAASGADVKHTRKKPHLKKEPNTGASPTLRGTDSLLELEQRLSAGMSNDEVHGQDPGAARPSKRARRACGASAAAPATRQVKPTERTCRKRTASRARQESAEVAEAPDVDMECQPAAQVGSAEPSEADPPCRKRRKNAEPVAAAAAKTAETKVSKKRGGKARSAAPDSAPTEDVEAGTSHAAQAPAPASRAGKRKKSASAPAAAGRASSVPSTPRQWTSARPSAADALLSPTRERQEPVVLLSSGVSLPKKLMNKAKAAGLRVCVHKSGGVVAEFTHFVADELVLSLHALIALVGGRPIVTTAWLHQSIDGGAAMPVGSLLLEDLQAEKKYKFIMKSSYDAARSKKLLQGCVCCVSDGLIKSEADGGEGLKLVLQAALGSDGQLLEGNQALAEYMSARGPEDDVRCVMLVEAGVDKRSLRRAVPQGVQVWTRPQFVQAVVQQTFAHQNALLQT